jgi:hypothetical protein
MMTHLHPARKDINQVCPAHSLRLRESSSAADGLSALFTGFLLSGAVLVARYRTAP